ncbi:MAG: FAD-binding protein, partial [Alphaproteobacteria bacterium]
MPAPPFDADIILVGGGMAGLTLALAAGQAGLSVIVLDAAPLAASLEAAFDGRVSALGRASVRLMTALGVWPQMAKFAQPILDILVSDGRIGGGPSPLSLHFDHLEGDNHTSGQALGHIIENRHIRAALHAALAGCRAAVTVRGQVMALAAIP